MRSLKIGPVGAVAAMLIVPGIGWTAGRSKLPPLSQPAAAAQFPGGVTAPPSPSPMLLVAEEPDQNRSNAPPGSGEGVGRSFQKFGHAVENGAKGVGHTVESGAKHVGRSVVEAWESFKRNFTGR